MNGTQSIETEIRALIKQSAFKQCYKRINELRSRYPKSAYYEILELYVKYKHLPQQFDIDKILIKPYAINKTVSNKITNDLRALDLLYRMLIEMNYHDYALNAFDLAHSKFGGLELAYEYFDRALQCFDYRRLIEASAALCSYSNLFPYNNSGNTVTTTGTSKNYGRMFNFWNAIATIAYFRYQKNRVTVQESKILPRLAFERLEKLKPLKSEQETIIYCMVCEELYSDNGIDSNMILGGLKDSLNLYMKQFLIKHVKDQQLLFDACLSLLTKIDDFQLIQKLIDSGFQLGKTEQEILNLIDQTVGDSRNSRLSRFEVDLTYNKAVSQESLSYYLKKFHDKSCCETDIQKYRENINEKTLEIIMHNLPNDSPIHDSNIFKLNLVPKEDSVILYQRHKKSLDKKLKTDYSSNSVFIMDIINRKILPNKTLKDKLLAITILENYQQRDIHNFQTALLLIQLYMDIGLPTLAHLVFKGLKIKNVQVDSMDYVLYTRFGSIFPNKQHEMISNDLIEHLKTYQNINGKLSQFVRIALERQSYSKIEGMIDLQNKLVKSMTRWILMCEQLEMARLYNDRKKRTTLLIQFHEEWNDMVHCAKMSGNDETIEIFSDNRDMSYMHDQYNLYSKINVEWLLVKVIKEFMLESISNDSNKDIIQRLVDKIGDIEENVCMTPMEKWSYKVISSIYYSEEGNEIENTERIRTLLERPHDSKQENWLLLHNYLTHLNTLKSIAGLKGCQLLKPIIQGQLTVLRNSCDEIFFNYRDAIKDSLSKIAKDNLLTELEYQPLQESMFLDALLSIQKFVRNL